MIQLSILKISGYGPWTLTLGSDREHALQMLQASLYQEIQKLFSEKNCLVFLNRADEFFVVSNGLNLEDHIEIQKNLENSFDADSCALEDPLPQSNTSAPFSIALKCTRSCIMMSRVAGQMGKYGWKNAVLSASLVGTSISRARHVLYKSGISRENSGIIITPSSYSDQILLAVGRRTSSSCVSCCGRPEAFCPFSWPARTASAVL